MDIALERSRSVHRMGCIAVDRLVAPHRIGRTDSPNRCRGRMRPAGEAMARTSLQADTRRRYRHAAMGILRTEHSMGKPRTHARGHNKPRHLHGGTPNA